MTSAKDRILRLIIAYDPVSKTRAAERRAAPKIYVCRLMDPLSAL
jgi:hypothetical protein